jgi:hypothetical protein
MDSESFFAELEAQGEAAARTNHFYRRRARQRLARFPLGEDQEKLIAKAKGWVVENAGYITPDGATISSWCVRDAHDHLVARSQRSPHAAIEAALSKGAYMKTENWLCAI